MNILGRNMMVKEVLSNVCLPFLRASRQARQLQTAASQVCRKLAGPWRRAHANTSYETFGQERKPETGGRTKTNATLMEANMLVRSECDTQNIERNDAKTHIMDMYGDVIFCPPHMNGFFISSQFFAYCAWGICMHLPHEGLLVSIWRMPAVEACPANTNV